MVAIHSPDIRRAERDAAAHRRDAAAWDYALTFECETESERARARDEIRHYTAKAEAKEAEVARLARGAA